MNNRVLTPEEIRNIAWRTTGQSHSSDGKAYRNGKLTSSKFGRAIRVMHNAHPTKVQPLRDELYVRKNLAHVPAIRWGLDHESVAIDACKNKSGSIVKPTGVWMFRNYSMGASPDGLVFTWPSRRVCCGHPRCQVPLFDARCERVVARRVAQLSELSRLQKQSQEVALLLSPNPRGDGSGWGGVVRLCHLDPEQYEDLPHSSRWRVVDALHPHLESFYKHQITRKEDFDVCFSDAATGDTDEEPFQPYEHPARHLTSILHPIGPAPQYRRHMGTQCLHVHLSRMIYHMQSVSRSEHKWRKAVDQFWTLAFENICESCIRKMFPQKDQRDILPRALTVEVNIVDDSSVWSELLFDPDYAAMLKRPVFVWWSPRRICGLLHAPPMRTRQRLFGIKRRSGCLLVRTLSLVPNTKLNSMGHWVNPSQSWSNPANPQCWSTNVNSPWMKGTT